MTYYHALEDFLREAPSVAEPRPIREHLLQAAGRDEVLYFAPLGTAALIDPDGQAKILEFPIAERSVLGAALGATLLGRYCVVEVGALSFAMVGYDMLTTARTLYRNGWSPKQGRILLFVTSGTSNDTHGVQHEWGSWQALASLNMAVVALSTPRDLKPVSQWWLSDADRDVVAVIDNATLGVPAQLHDQRAIADSDDIVLTVGAGAPSSAPDSSGSLRTAVELEVVLPLDEAYLHHLLAGISDRTLVTWCAPSRIWSGAEVIADRVLRSCRGRGLDAIAENDF